MSSQDAPLPPIGLPEATGRSRLFAEPLHVGRPNLADANELLNDFRVILERRWLTNNGPCVKEFEHQVAAHLGVRNCIAVSNATIGLQITIAALGLSGEVIVPSFTFPATVHALAWQGIRPIFCDVDLSTHNLAPASVERLIGPQTTGILGVHLWGNACAIEPLTEIARRHRLALFFDAAHAFDCSHRGRMIGNFGSAEVFSFHATKFLNTGEGGAVTTNDDELAAKLRRLRNFGLEDDQVVDVGINGKMNEFSAAMGLASLRHRELFIARNHSNFAAYRDVLRSIPGLSLVEHPTTERRNQQYIVVDVDRHQFGMSRDELVTALHAQNVIAKRYFFPGCHRVEPYKSAGAASTPLTNTEALCERLFQLPTGTAVSRNDIERIGEFLKTLTARARHAA